MGWYDVYDSNDSLIASDVWIDEGYHNWDYKIRDIRDLGRLMYRNIVFIIWCILSIVLPLIFIFLILPKSEKISYAILDGGSLIVLWIFSLINLFIGIKKKIFLHRLYKSNDKKYKRMREEMWGKTTIKNIAGKYVTDDTSNNEDLKNEEQLFAEEIKNPLRRTLKSLRISLIFIFIGIIILGIIFSKKDITAYSLAFVGPLFAYTYIFDIVNSYITYGKKANWIWLGFLVVVFISSLLMEIAILKKYLEYLLFALLLGMNEVIFKLFEKKEK